ncbi:hypothetical protein UFOVP45_26 [uncultured Caudovirales phage]|uniref:Uncharacterized protein n=1 Tax=uncultured Caudovirales phage TaxID=2100421 RepID=A0A6J5KN29_9CAUD|nr:hypothetical protein UFOVP45_26 [uncultured Caudovirales phage]
MAIAYKVLGQSSPAATTQTTLYTAPSATSTVVSTITVANTNGTAVTVRIAVQPAGATLAAQHYIAYGVSIPANTTTALTLGITLATTDVVSVYASTTGVSFSAFGSEIS